MSEIIYVSTVIYFAYVVDDVEGDRIVAFFKDVLKINFSKIHIIYRKLRDSLLNFISSKTASFG